MMEDLLLGVLDEALEAEEQKILSMGLLVLQQQRFPASQEVHRAARRAARRRHREQKARVQTLRNIHRILRALLANTIGLWID